MSIRRKSTTHDLATLRLHPDGSRVQQSSTNVRRRTARSTLVDSRGNWIARDAAGKTSVKLRRRTNKVPVDDAEGEFFDLSGDEEQHTQSKGKQRACDDQIPNEEPKLGTRARQRLSFLRDLSFLDPPPVSVSSLEQDVDATSPRESFVSFPDPAPVSPSSRHSSSLTSLQDLLKSIHHFANCYYRERGQLFDSSRDFRGRKKERRRKSSQDNIHALVSNTREHRNMDPEEDTETEDETIEEDDDVYDVMDAGDNGKRQRTRGETYEKDMYKALDGSALMAIGIVLQEYVAHTLLSRPAVSEEPRSLN